MYKFYRYGGIVHVKVGTFRRFLNRYEYSSSFNMSEDTFKAIRMPVVIETIEKWLNGDCILTGEGVTKHHHGYRIKSLRDDNCQHVVDLYPKRRCVFVGRLYANGCFPGVLMEVDEFHKLIKIQSLEDLPEWRPPVG